MNKKDICDQALALIGEREYSPVNQAPPSRMCDKMFRSALNEVLSAGHWSFAKTDSHLIGGIPYPVINPTGFSFSVPDGCLRLLHVFSNKWSLTGRKIIVRDGDGASLDIEYINNEVFDNGDDVDIPEELPLFAYAVVVKLAEKLAVPVSGKLELANSLRNIYRYSALLEALHMDKLQDGSNDQLPGSEPYNRRRV